MHQQVLGRAVEHLSHLALGRQQFPLHKSADLASVLFFQLIGDAAAWSTLANRLGVATWNGIAQLLERKEVGLLADVAPALAAAANNSDGEAVSVDELDKSLQHAYTDDIAREHQGLGAHSSEEKFHEQPK